MIYAVGTNVCCMDRDVDCCILWWGCELSLVRRTLPLFFIIVLFTGIICFANFCFFLSTSDEISWNYHRVETVFAPPICGHLFIVSPIRLFHVELVFDVRATLFSKNNITISNFYGCRAWLVVQLVYTFCCSSAYFEYFDKKC